MFTHNGTPRRLAIAPVTGPRLHGGGFSICSVRNNPLLLRLISHNVMEECAMSNNPDEKVGDDYPGDGANFTNLIGQFFPFAVGEHPRKGKLGHRGNEAPPNPHEQEPNNKPS